MYESRFVNICFFVYNRWTGLRNRMIVFAVTKLV